MKVNPIIFYLSAAVVAVFVLLGAVFTEPMARFFEALQHGIVSNMGWFYILSVAFFLGFVVFLYFTPYGRLKLGKDDDKPEFSYGSWFAMLFSAGMGIGLLFYSVAEPILHLQNPPRAQSSQIETALQAVNYTFFHWGLHAWAIYIVVGLSLGFFAFRHNLPLTIRSSMYPLIGDRIYGWPGDAVDLLAVFGTLFGVATSLGLGVMQINAGLEYLGVLPVSEVNQLLLIGGITLAATVSVISGLHKGIRILSSLNIYLGLILLIFVFLVGPTVFLLNSFVQSLGYYLQHILEYTFRTDAFRGPDWQQDWTMFFWGWWISWSPFVGMFIARISKGRTIREFISGVLLVPSVITFLWLIVFGNTAIHLELFGSAGLGAAVSANIPTAIFHMLTQLPWGLISSAVVTLVIAMFFITSADSGALVMVILTSGGTVAPPLSRRIFWALTEGAVAAVLLVAGGLQALQTAALTTALPFCGIMLLMCHGLFKGLRNSYVTGSLDAAMASGRESG
jgi:choline/glycine/proline betaine transport protein